jgi:phosphatidate cytidylyltransferase
MLIARLATAIILLAVSISALLFLSNVWWMAFLLPVLAIASWEWSTLAGGKPVARWAFLAIVLVSAITAWQFAVHPATALFSPVETLIYGAGCAFWALVAIPWMVQSWHVRSPLALCLAGWCVLLPAWLALVRLQENPGQLLAVLAIIWLADTAAYFSGRAWGRHKLAPSISPGKTWEGAAGAAVAVAVYYFVLHRAVPEWSWWNGFGGALLFLGVAAMSVVGDLFESTIKRQAGVKDSGTLLPGHGGILDRIDSVTAALPFAALLMPHAG